MFLSIGVTACGKKKKGLLPFTPFAFMGAEAEEVKNTNPSGDPLPDNVGTNNSYDENGIPLFGSVQISGNILLYDGADSNGNPIQVVLCTSPNVPTNCIDLTNLEIQLLDPNGKVVATTKPNYDGSFTFNLENLPNNNYQIFIPKAQRISSAFVDFNFTYDPTQTTNRISVPNLVTTTYYFEKGAAILSGTVITPGYVDANGNSVLNAGNLPLGTPVKLYIEDPNGNITLSAFSGKTFSLLDSTTLLTTGYTFNRTNPNEYLEDSRKYVIAVEGSAVTQNGRPFKDAYLTFTFNYNASKTDNSIPTLVNLSPISCEWDAANSALANISGTIINSAFPSANKSGFVVTLRDGAGNAIATTITDSSGTYSFSNVLKNGTYSVEVTKTGFYNQSSAFTYIAHANGSSQNITLPTLGILAKDSKVTGEIKDTFNNPVPNAVISFRPASTLSASDLNYIITNVNVPIELKTLAQKWQQEKITHGAFLTWATKSYEKEYNCSDGSKTNIQANGKLGCPPETITTTPTGKLIMTVLAGTWDYFISATGYESTSIGTEWFNGEEKEVTPPLLIPSPKRSIISGYAVLLDTTTDGAKRYYANSNIPNLNSAGYTKITDGLANFIAIMLNNKNNTGQSVAHLALTSDQGRYEFTNLHVVLPSSLTTDSDRVAYAVSEYAKFLANPSSCGCAVIVDKSTISSESSSSAASLYEMGGRFYFKQGTYNVFIVDPKKYSSISATTINNSNVAATSGIDLDPSDNTDNTVSLVQHLPRRNITGTVSDAVTTASISGAILKLCTSINSDESCNAARMDAVPIFDIAQANGGRLAPEADLEVPFTTTDANGNYTFTNVNPGNYILQITKEGYAKATMTITVPSSSDGLSSGNTVSGINPKLVQDNHRGNITGVVMKTLPVSSAIENFTGAYTVELIHPMVGTRPTSDVTPSKIATGAANYSTPTYNIYNVNPGEWKIKFNANGYLPIEGLVTVQPARTVTFNMVTMIPSNTPPANITGRTLNAMVSGQPVAGLTIRLRYGVNVTSGPYALDSNGNTIPPVTSNSTGSFVIPNVPAGNYTLEVSGIASAPSNFGEASTTYTTVISAGPSTPPSQDILVAPKLNSTEVRIVLSWNSVPKDLDSHLEFGSSAPAQVTWNQPNRFCNNSSIENLKAIVPQNPPPTHYGSDGRPITRPDICNLTLDVDVTTGSGPETITIKNTVSNANNPWTAPRRGYTIFNWSRAKAKDTSLTIGKSGAVVRVFKSQGLVRTFNVNPNEVGDWWNVFCLDEHRNIIDLGTGTCTNSSFFNADKN